MACFTGNQQALLMSTRLSCTNGRRPFASVGVCRAQVTGTKCVDSNNQVGTLQRRDLLQLGSLAALSLAMPGVAEAKPPKGFGVIRDPQDGYSFLYPFGWQEITVDGQDVVYKDVIEPLESVSVNLTVTDKADVTEFGEVKEVAYTLANQVLTAPTTDVKLVSASERSSEDGRKYYEFEFLADTGRYTRHALAVVTVANGKFYTLTTGANERRWGKMKDKLETVVKSFEVSDRF